LLADDKAILEPTVDRRGRDAEFFAVCLMLIRSPAEEFVDSVQRGISQLRRKLPTRFCVNRRPRAVVRSCRFKMPAMAKAYWLGYHAAVIHCNSRSGTVSSSALTKHEKRLTGLSF